MAYKIVDEDDDWHYHECQHREHNPPRMIVIPAGKKMVHECPACHKKTTIHGSRIKCKVKDSW